MKNTNYLSLQFGFLFCLVLFTSTKLKAQTLSFNLSADTVLIGDSITFINESTGFNSNTQFVWKYGERNCGIGIDPDNECTDTINSTESANYVYSFPGSYTVTLSANDAFGNPFNSQKIIIVNASASVSALNDCATAPASPCEMIYNGNFEQYTPCPTDLYRYNNVIQHTFAAQSLGQNGILGQYEPVVCDWNYASGTPDFFLTNSLCHFTCSIPVTAACSFYQNNGSFTSPNWVQNNMAGCEGSHTPGTPSSAYVGVITFSGTTTDKREYIQQPLRNPLIAGRCYRISFWVSLAERDN